MLEARRLTKSPLVETDDFVLEDVVCRSRSRGWSEPEEASVYGFVFLRRGCFRRRVNGVEMLVDPTVVYFERPGDEQQIAHPAGGDACTALCLSADLLASLTGGEPQLPARAVPTRPELDLRQRLLFGLVARRGDLATVAEAVVCLAADVLEHAAPRAIAAGRPSTAAARRRAVDGAREALIDDPSLGVLELARWAAVSPHHLSRVFRAETGETISRYRNRLRVRLALERLAEGEPCLARLAADLGFADQAHLARVVSAELGSAPSHLRTRLAPGSY